MRVLFLDDDGFRRGQFQSAVPSATIVETAQQCIAALADDPWDFVFLDHDLGGEQFCQPSRENTGSEVARWIAANQPEIGVVVLHTFNHVGMRAMAAILEEADYRCEYIPFGKECGQRVYEEVRCGDS